MWCNHLCFFNTNFTFIRPMRRMQTRIASRLVICRFTPRLFLRILISSFLLSYNFSLQAQSRGRGAISPEAYWARLQTVGEDTLRIEYELEFVVLLEESEKKIFNALPAPQRREYIARYWRLREPDPFTPLNERLEEHLRRRDYARENFAAKAPPYFDDRGRIYLKYGRPQFRYVDPGAHMLITQDLSILVPDGGYVGEQAIFDSTGIRRISPSGSANPWERTKALLPPGSVTVLANETWSYDQIHAGLLFNFVKQGAAFKMTPDLQNAVFGGRMQHRALQAAALYLQRQAISAHYFDLARELEDIGQELRSPTGGQASRRRDDKIHHAVHRTTSDVKDVIKEALPAAFIYKTAASALPFVADIAQFRGEQNQTRVAIGMGVNLGEQGMESDSTGVWLSSVTYGCVLNDLNGARMAQADQRQIIPVTAAGSASILGSVGMMELRCVPAPYILALQATAANETYKSLAQLPLAVRDFRGANLMLSDIQFYLPISDSSDRKILYPFGAALKTLPLTIYFEIYNLTAIGLEKNYRVDYNIIAVQSGKKIVNKLIKPFSKNEVVSITLSELRAVTQPTVRDSLALNLEKLRPGRYQLEIAVRAEDNAALVAKASKQFVLAAEN